MRSMAAIPTGASHLRQGAYNGSQALARRAASVHLLLGLVLPSGSVTYPPLRSLELGTPSQMRLALARLGRSYT